MKLDERELNVLQGVLREVLSMKDIHQHLGSLTILEAETLYYKLKYRAWCDQHHVEWGQLTEEQLEKLWIDTQESEDKEYELW